jgi:HEPN domain-containing protein
LFGWYSPILNGNGKAAESLSLRLEKGENSFKGGGGLKMTKSRVFKKSYAEQLMRIAQGDLEAATILAKGNTTRKENIFFHAGQAIEKAIKCVLCHRGEAVPLTHDLNILIERIPVERQLPYADQLEDLSQFATIRRYEEGAAIFTDEEIEAVLKAAEAILSWAAAQLILHA